MVVCVQIQVIQYSMPEGTTFEHNTLQCLKLHKLPPMLLDQFAHYMLELNMTVVFEQYCTYLYKFSQVGHLVLYINYYLSFHKGMSECADSHRARCMYSELFVLCLDSK